MASRKTEAQKRNDTPHVTSRSVLQQETGAALPSINQRHFLAAAKNATLKQRQLWKVFDLTVHPRTYFVTFQNSERTSLVKKHGTTPQEKQDVFLQDLLKSSCGFCDRIRATVRAENPALWQARERIALKACSRLCFYSAQIYRQIRRKRKLRILGPTSTMKWIKALGMADYLGFNKWFMDIV